jgi:hypothetical protein
MSDHGTIPSPDGDDSRARPGSPPPPAPTYGEPPAAPPYGQPPAAPQYGGVAPSQPVARPASMDRAVQLMKIGAVLALVGVGVVFLEQDAMRSAVETAFEDAGQSVDSTTVDAAVLASLGVGAVMGVIGAGLWWWMAIANGRGRSWARIVSTVFFGLSTMSLLASLIQPQPVLSRVLGIVQWLVGLAVIVLIWRRESSQFYRANSAPVY